MSGPVLSVSQVEKFDHQQEGGCARKWWFEVVQGLKPEMSQAQTDGDLGHALLATYLATGEKPKGRVKMGKAVTGAILKGELPEPGPHLLVEKRFDGQNKRDENGNWIPVDLAKTLHLAGLPWDGFIDLRYRSDDGLVHVVDHKFSSDPDTYAKPADALIKTVQLPVYVLDSLRLWPDADTFRIAHHYVSKKGVHSFFREAIVGRSEIEERKADIERVVSELQQIRAVEKQDDVPFSRRACTAFNGCPHQSICKAFKENQMSVSAEEMALFDGLEDLSAQVKERVPGEDDGDPAPAVAVDELEELFGGIATAPEPSKPAEQTPACDDCGAELNAENGSKLRSGKWQHIGCPVVAELPLMASAPAKAEEPKDPRQHTEDCPVTHGASVDCVTGHECPKAEEVWELAKPTGATPAPGNFLNPEEAVSRPKPAKKEKKPTTSQEKVTPEEVAEFTDSLRAASATEERPAPPTADVTEAIRKSALTPESIPTSFTVTVRVELGERTLALLESLVRR